MTPAIGCAVSHIGNSRENQEDNFLLNRGLYITPNARERMISARELHCQMLEFDKRRFLSAVSDGMGGHACGEVASLLTVEYLSDRYDDIIDSVLIGEKSLANRISRVNDIVTTTAKKDKACKGMGATLCGVVSNGYELFGFNVGDSRVYQLKNGVLSQLSVDHTEGQRLIRMKLLTEDEEKRFPRRKMLHKYLGYDGDLNPDIFRIDCGESGSTLMLCSDGLSDALEIDDIERILKCNENIEEKTKRLVNEAVLREIGHGDNVTVLLIEF